MSAEKEGGCPCATAAALNNHAKCRTFVVRLEMLRRMLSL
jgi:hypothetical protein